jgi:hypothetical protein
MCASTAVPATTSANLIVDADLRSILDHQAYQDAPVSPTRASEDHSLQPGTRA